MTDICGYTLGIGRCTLREGHVGGHNLHRTRVMVECGQMPHSDACEEAYHKRRYSIGD